MAGNLPVTNGTELKLVWTLSGVPYALNILHAIHPVGQTHTQAIANSIDTAVKSALTASALPAQLANTVALLRVSSRNMDSLSDPWFDGSAAALPGTAAGKPLPAANCLVVTNRTGLRGRSYNGRTYLTGFAEIANDSSGGATTAAATAASSFLNAIRTGVLGAPMNLTLGVLSRYWTPPGTTETVERVTPLINTITGSFMLDQRWDVQRRRAIPGI